MHDDQFTATGPSHHSSGFPKAAFSTGQGESSKDFDFGVKVIGGRFGVVGRSTVQGWAGVYGDGHFCRIGVLGTTTGNREQRSYGVAGISVHSTMDFNNVNVPPRSVELKLLNLGDDVGVVGLSGTSSGVQGMSSAGAGGEFSSQAGSGVWTRSRDGWALHAASENDRGGVFGSSTQKNNLVAQIRLVPLEQRGQGPKLPKAGQLGDMILIHTKHSEGLDLVRESCSLWLCTPRPPGLVTAPGQGAFWRQIQLGEAVEGTE